MTAVHPLTPPENRPPELDHEAQLLGALLNDPSLAATIGVRPEHYANPHHATIHEIIAATYAVHGDDTTVLRVVEAITARADGRRLLGLFRNGVSLVEYAATQAPNPVWHAERIIEAATVRRIGEVRDRLGTIVAGATAGTIDPDDVLEHAVRSLIAITPDTPRRQELPPDLDDFLATEDAPYDWIIPGLLERGDRVIVTGPEGGGKSTFLRQLAVQAAAGIHPFTHGPVDPIRVLLVDVENSAMQVRRQLRPLRLSAGTYPKGNLRIEIRTAGINLLDAGDARWLDDLSAAVAPDLLVTGPIYRMADGDPTEEMPAKAVSRALDRIRARGTAIILEAHSPHAAAGGRRPERPYGASMWMRWPEFGIYLSEVGEVKHWRGAREERDWPALLRRGGTWPWSPCSDPYEGYWLRIAGHVRDTGEVLSTRGFGDLLGIPKSTVARVIKRYQDQWTALIGDLEPAEDD